MNKIRMNINGTEVIGHSGQTILEIAKDNNIEIPTLCHDERVEPYGSCGLCIVEVEGMNKLLRSCSTVASDGMIISTNTKKVNDSRKIALELLLSDHTGDCKAPCTLACPGDTDCQGYVGLVANGEDEAAVELLKEKLPLPASIGRVCPHPCETACRRDKLEEPVSIAIIKRFVGDVDLRNKEQFMPEIKASTGKKVAIIGGGPGGLTAGYFLAKEGHKPTIYEAMPELGGMLRYGIPQYRLPKEVLNEEIEIIKNMGVEMLSNIKIGKDIKLDYIREKYDAVYVSIGAWNSTELNCPGEELDGVIGGIEFLSKFTLNKPVKTGEKIAVVGGGNTAMDACRTAIRLGAKEVYALYRRTQAEMPAEEIEIEEAMEEGVNFKFLVSPSEIIGENGKVSKVKLQKMKLGEKDARGRRRPIPIEGEFEILEVDSVISAVGQKIDIKGLEELELTQRGTIAADENSFSTNLEGVFAGGDATNKGPDIAIAAIGDAKKAVNVMNGYLEGKAVKYEKPFYVTREDVDVKEFSHRKIEHRPRLEVLDPEIRKTNFEEVVSGYSEEDARKEAMRCLECGCGDLFECKLLEFSNEYKVEPERLEGEMHNRKNDDNHPFIIRDSDKCILCGLCVRVCEDVVKSNALALIDRGFDTKVEPAFGKTLQESECVSCGMCVSVCPTGA
ncbi:MAG: FAD-dependent oxidoreductase, partial [Senegalia sp. (in: firmicutes)]